MSSTSGQERKRVVHAAAYLAAFSSRSDLSTTTTSSSTVSPQETTTTVVTAASLIPAENQPASSTAQFHDKSSVGLASPPSLGLGKITAPQNDSREPWFSKDTPQELSLHDRVVGGGLLRESVFPYWKNGTPGGGYENTDELQKQDPLATQIWKLYSRTKSQLPNQERMENLTWRMMAMNLRKKRERDEANMSEKTRNLDNSKPLQYVSILFFPKRRRNMLPCMILFTFDLYSHPLTFTSLKWCRH